MYSTGSRTIRWHHVFLVFLYPVSPFGLGQHAAFGWAVPRVILKEQNHKTVFCIGYGISRVGSFYVITFPMVKGLLVYHGDCGTHMQNIIIGYS